MFKIKGLEKAGRSDFKYLIENYRFIDFNKQ